MNKNMRYFWLFLVVFLFVLGFTLISVADTNLQEGSFLPLVLVLETPTPSPTSTPTPTPTPEPTVVARPRLRDGDYYVSLSGEVGGDIAFLVKDNGGTVHYASFIYYWYNPPGCGPRYWAFPGSKPIINGHFAFVATDGVTVFANMFCSAISSTSAMCSVAEPGGAWLGTCGRPVLATLHLQN